MISVSNLCKILALVACVAAYPGTVCDERGCRPLDPSVTLSPIEPVSSIGSNNRNTPSLNFDSDGIRCDDRGCGPINSKKQSCSEASWWNPFAKVYKCAKSLF